MIRSGIVIFDAHYSPMNVSTSMANLFKSIIKTQLRRLGILSLYSLTKEGPLRDDGWFRSYREQESIDSTGKPLPWITYPAIEFIQRRINKRMKVFEFGSGGSTLWWADRVSEIISIEHDRNWYRNIDIGHRPNVTIYHTPLDNSGEYSGKILHYHDLFDIVVIDGRDRVNCMKNCICALKSDGIVILDNSDRSEYEEGIDFLRAQGFKKIEFVGLCPIINAKSETSILYRPINALGI